MGRSRARRPTVGRPVGKAFACLQIHRTSILLTRHHHKLNFAIELSANCLESLLAIRAERGSVQRRFGCTMSGDGLLMDVTLPSGRNVHHLLTIDLSCIRRRRKFEGMLSFFSCFFEETTLFERSSQVAD